VQLAIERLVLAGGGVVSLTEQAPQRLDKAPAAFDAASDHGRSRSGGLSDSMNQRTASAPYWSMISSGSTTFFFDFDIFSTRPIVDRPRRHRPHHIAFAPRSTSSG
jgi:hypothetical protein